MFCNLLEFGGVITLLGFGEVHITGSRKTGYIVTKKKKPHIFSFNTKVCHIKMTLKNH